MKYLTKEWYELCQQEHLHYGKRVHSGAAVRDEVFFSRLYKKKEQECISQQRELYNLDPRTFLSQAGAGPALILHHDGTVTEEDPASAEQYRAEERAEMEQIIAKYDARPPFDEAGCREQFRKSLEWQCQHETERLPRELTDSIADMRVYVLGYCTREVKRQLKKLSAVNKKRVGLIGEQYRTAQEAEGIPDSIRHIFGFHDCTVTECSLIESSQEAQLVLRFDTRGGFTSLNKLTFIDAEVIKQDARLVGSHWLYEELYRTEHGYEAHMLFYDRRPQDLIVRCRDIRVDQE